MTSRDRASIPHFLPAKSADKVGGLVTVRTSEFEERHLLSQNCERNGAFVSLIVRGKGGGNVGSKATHLGGVRVSPCEQHSMQTVAPVHPRSGTRESMFIAMAVSM